MKQTFKTIVKLLELGIYTRKIKIIVFLLFIANSLYSQEINSSDFNRIAEALKLEYLNSYLTNDNNELNDDCIYGKEEGFTLSCISAHWETNWITDFDGDEINDVVIRITDGGLGGGGNAFGYSFDIVTLDEQKNIKNTYSIFGGGKLSFALLSIDKVEDGIIYSTYEKNSYGNMFDETTETVNNINFEFFLENNQLKERSYTSCGISEMDKSIFKDNLDFEIKRNLTLDDSFNQNQDEHLYLKDNTYYYASISGCDDINLYFTHTIPYKEELESNKYKIKKIWLEHLVFLKTNTRYKTILNNLYSKLKLIQDTSLVIGKYGGSDLKIELNNGWIGYLFVSGNKEQGSFITFRLIKVPENGEKGFWEALEEKTNR